MLWVTLLLAMLAAGAVAEFVRRAEHLAAQRMPPWPGPWLRLATLVPLLLVLVEGLNATAHPVVPAQPAAMRTVDGPMLVLPTAALERPDRHALVDVPVPADRERRRRLRRRRARPSCAAPVALVPGRGEHRVPAQPRRSTTVLLLRAGAGTPWERAGDVPVDTLGIRREDLDDDHRPVPAELTTRR